MSAESKRRSTLTRTVIACIVGCIVLSYILTEWSKISLGSYNERVEIKDQYYMPSHWGSHECSRSSSPCKDIPSYFKGMIDQNFIVLNLNTCIYCAFYTVYFVPSILY